MHDHRRDAQTGTGDSWPGRARLSVALAAALALLGGCGELAELHDSHHGHDEDEHHDEAVEHDDAGEHDEHDHAAGEDPHAAHEDEVSLTSEAVARHGVATEAAQLRHLQPTLVAPARVAFDTEAMAHVGSPLRGRITEVPVRVGDSVQVGDELAVIESPELGEAQAEFLQRGVAVQTAGPAVELSKIAWERAKGLFEQSQGISLTEVQRREAEYKAALAALKAAESATQASRNRLHLLGMTHEEIGRLAETGEVVPRYAIRAAIDGLVVQREVTLGELVSPDREYLMVLADATRLWVLADVPEVELRSIATGAQAWVSTGSLGSEGEERLEGTVTFISPLVNPTTRTAQVRIEVPVGDASLRPGMFAQAEIATRDPGDPEPRALVAVPEAAVQNVEGGPVLFVPVDGEPDTFALRSVEVGRAVGGLVPVLSGLAEGELFVSAGAFILKAELGKGAAAHEH